MKISEITRHLESISPLSFQEDYDNSGLLVGDDNLEFGKALLCLDLTEDVMAEALKKNCNLVISHHPFIFRGIKKLIRGKPETEIISAALTNNIAVYAVHTNLDNTLHGLNARVLRKLGVQKYRILSPKQGMLSKLATFCPAGYAGKVRDALFDAGAGHIGNYDCCSYNVEGEGTFRASADASPFVGEKNILHSEKETRVEVIFPVYLRNQVIAALIAAHPYEEVAYDIYPLGNHHFQSGSGLTGELEIPLKELEFLELVKRELGIPMIRHSYLRSKDVKTIAICTGSGSFLIPEALRSAADVYLTADLKYHDFFGLKNDLLLADIGHYESEQWVKEWLHDALIEKFPTFAFLISEVNTNPVHYF